MRRKLFLPFIICCAAASLIFQVFAFGHFEFITDFRLVIFALLLLMNSHYQVISLNSRSSFSVNFPLLFPIICCFGPFWASVLAAIGLISADEFGLEPPVFLFNRASLGLAAGLSSIVFIAAGGADNLLWGLTMALITYSVLNHALFFTACYLRKDYQVSAANLLLDTLKTILPSVALSGLFYIAFLHFDVFGIIGAYFIFITVRSGALLGHLESNYRVSVIRALLRAVYAKDPNLMSHLENVAFYTKKLAKACHYPIWKMQILDEASYFHDIGKLEIADSILKKAGSLTVDEYSEMKSHPLRGIDFLKEVPLPRTHREIVENIAGYHHERFDGNGYPRGLKGEEIPLEARIVAVADTWDAMVGKRCYRNPMPISEAIAELRRVAGTQLDPDLVEKFIDLIEDDLEKDRKRMIMHNSLVNLPN